MNRTILIFLCVFFNLLGRAQEKKDSSLSFHGDFRFRAEHDWNSQKTDGSFRDDRSRLRYRVRLGLDYSVNSWSSLGVGVRTGKPNKQQDPQLTLGDDDKEFTVLPIGLEKAYFQANYNDFFAWVGKNSFSFQKNNELFWSDNVYPEGVFLKKDFTIKSKTVNKIGVSLGHYIIGSNGKSFGEDSYFEGLQINLKMFQDKLYVFPSFYSFKNIPDVPDVANTTVFDYSIIHVGARIKVKKKPLINLELDAYSNLTNYDNIDEIPSNLKNQKTGFICGVSYGKLKTNRDWNFKATYTYLERYAAVDFLAQNDWARWDYLSFDSPDGRLTNFKGFEFVAGYKLNNNMNLIMKYYLVDQLIAYGGFKETGSRIRLDLDISFN